MKALTDTVAHLAAMPWLMAGVAAVLAAVLLAGFVEAVQENARHGEAFRQQQRLARLATVHTAQVVDAQAPRPPLR